MEDEPGKDHGQRYPDGGPDPRFSIPDSVSFSVEEAEIEAQHSQNEKTESDP